MHRDNRLLPKTLGTAAVISAAMTLAGCDKSTVHVEVRDYFADTPIQNAQVCIVSAAAAQPSCVTTNAQGEATIELPPVEREVIVHVPGTDYLDSNLVLRADGAEFALRTRMLTKSSVQLMAQLLGVTYDESQGLLAASVYAWPGGWPQDLTSFSEPSEGLAGSSISLAAVSGGSSAFLGPYYVNAAGLPNPALTATTTAGASVFAALSPGEYTAEVTTPSTHSCNHRWMAPRNGRPLVIARPGTVSGLWTRCAPGPAPEPG